MGTGLALTSALVTAEVALRALRPHGVALERLLRVPGEPPPVGRAATLDEVLALSWFRPPPFAIWGGFKLNSHGLATPEYRREKAANTYRVLALGDSFTFDSAFVSQDQLWHRLSGAAFAARRGQPVEVINLGVPAVGPRVARRLFEVEGQRLAPDLVLLGLFVGNDLTDEQGQRGPWLMLWSMTSWLAKRLVADVGLTERLARAGRLPPGTRDPDPATGGHPIEGYVYDAEAAFWDQATFAQVERRTAKLFARRAQPEVATWIAGGVDTVAALDRQVRAGGGELIVVLIPDQLQVDEQVRRAVLASGGLAADAYDFDWVQDALRTRLAEAGLEVVDLLPASRAAPPTPRLYRRNDTHWSAAGNALAAEVLVASGAGARRHLPR